MSEYRIKAAFLYNFTSYTEWPGNPDGRLILCVLGGNPFGAELNTIAGKVSRGRTIDVQQRAEADGVGGCDALFVSSKAIERLADINAEARGAPMLIVADSPDALRRGAMFNMFVSGDRVRFAINLRAARAAGLRIDPRVLRLAADVEQ